MLTPLQAYTCQLKNFSQAGNASLATDRLEPAWPIGRPAVIEEYNHPASSFAHNSIIPRFPLPQASIAPGFSLGIRENITHYIIPLHARLCHGQCPACSGREEGVYPN